MKNKNNHLRLSFMIYHERFTTQDEKPWMATKMLETSMEKREVVEEHCEEKEKTQTI